MPLSLTASSIITRIKNNLLKTLTFGDYTSKVSTDEMKLIIHALKDNISITELTIWSMKDETAEAVAEMLKVNRTIKIIKLWGAGITTAGALKLATAFKASATLKCFDLTNNPIDEEGVAALIDAVKSNKGLIAAYAAAPIHEREPAEWKELRKAARENAKAESVKKTKYEATLPAMEKWNITKLIAKDLEVVVEAKLTCDKGGEKAATDETALVKTAKTSSSTVTFLLPPAVIAAIGEYLSWDYITSSLMGEPACAGAGGKASTAIADIE